MATAQQKFWKLVIDGRLYALEECQRLHAEFRKVSSAPPDDAGALARWLVSEGVLSRYQARILLAGRAGPFWLGDFKILDRYEEVQVKGLYEALGRLTGERVLLLVVPEAAGLDLAKMQALARKVQKALEPAGMHLTPLVSFAVQGSLAFAVVAELAPPAAAEGEPEDEAEQVLPQWTPELSRTRARKVPRPVGGLLVGWGVALCLLVAAIAGAWLLMDHDGGTTNIPPPAPPPIAADAAASADGAANGDAQADSPAMTAEQIALSLRGPNEPAPELIDDDGQTLWASPTSGSPLDLGHLRGGAEAILVIRPAELVGSAEGAKMLDALGPAGTAAAAAIDAVTYCKWADIEQLQIAFYPADAGPLRVVYVVRLVPSLTVDDWRARLPDPTTASHAGKEYLQAGDWAYYLPESSAGAMVVVTTPAEIAELIDQGGGRLTKEMERLLADTDDTRHVTILGEPFSIFTTGQSIFAGPLARLAQPLQRFLGEGVQAALLSAQVGDDLFLELRAYAQVDKDPRQLAEHYRGELAGLPAAFEAYLSTLDPAPYGRAVLLRFPRMLEQLQRFTRAAAEHHQAVLRCYLPAVAGHNLLLGTELALAEVPTSGGSPAKPAPSAKTDVAAALARKVSLSFPRDTLEKSMEMLSTEIGVEIVILGSDLQLEGITKNQSFSLDERDEPGEEILLKVLKLANPDSKLVYVVKPRSGGGEPIIFVTTRAAAKKRGESLPASFEQK